MEKGNKSKKGPCKAHGADAASKTKADPSKREKKTFQTNSLWSSPQNDLTSLCETPHEAQHAHAGAAAEASVQVPWKKPCYEHDVKSLLKTSQEAELTSQKHLCH